MTTLTTHEENNGYIFQIETNGIFSFDDLFEELSEYSFIEDVIKITDNSIMIICEKLDEVNLKNLETSIFNCILPIV